MSELQTAFDEYLAVRRALGYKLRLEGRLLRQFVDFAERSGADYITTELALKWATQPAHAQPYTVGQPLRRWSRRFARYCSCPTIRAPWCRRLICFPISTVEWRRTFIATRRSAIYSRRRGSCRPRSACDHTPTPRSLAYMLPRVCGPTSHCVSIVTTWISSTAC